MTLTSAFSNTLPAGMTIVGASPAGTCTGVTATTGGNTVTMANGTQIPNGGCTITVSVASSVSGTRTVSVPAGAFAVDGGLSNAATSANLTVTPSPQISVSKSLPSGRGSGSDQFNLAVRTGGAGGTVVASGTTSGSGSTVTGGTGTFTGVTGTAYTITEAMTSGSGSVLGQYTSRITCNDSAGVTAGLPNNALFNQTTGYTTPALAATANVSCTISNTPIAPTISVRKAMNGSRLSNSDQFTVALRLGGAGGAPVNSTTNSTTTGAGSTVTAGTGTTGTVNVTAGTSYTITEAAAGTTTLSNYWGTITCTDANGFQGSLPNGAPLSPATGLNITPVAGAAISCTITNTLSPVISGLPSLFRIRVGQVFNKTYNINKQVGGSVAQSGIGFTDTLPPGFVVATPVPLQDFSTCGGTIVAVPGSSTIQLIGGTIAAGVPACNILVSITHAPQPRVSTAAACPADNLMQTSDIASLANLRHPAVPDARCVQVQPIVRLTKQVTPVAVSSIGQFNLSIGGAGANGGTNPANNIGNGGTTGYVAVDGGANVTLTESAGSGTNITTYAPSFACLDGNGASVTTGGSGTSRTLTAPNGTLPSAAAGTLECSFTNRATTLTLSKAWSPGSISGNAISIGATTGGATNTTAFTATAGTPATSNTITVVPGTNFTLPAETFTTGSASNYTTVISCLADGAPAASTLSGTNGQASGNILVVQTADTGKDIVCTYTNTALNRPTIALAFSPTSVLPNQPTTLTYTIGSTTGSAFTLASAFSSSLAANMRVVGIAPGGTCTGVTATTGGTTVAVASGTAIPAGGCTIEVSVAVFVSTGLPVSRTVTVPAGAIVASGGLSNASPASATVTVPSFTANFTFPGLTMSKALTSGRAHPSDQFVLTVSGIRSSPTTGPGSESVTTTGSGTVATGTTATFLTSTAAPPTGDNFTLTEAMAPGSASAIGQYNSTITCTDSTSGRPGAASLPLGAAFNPAGTVINRYNSADISCIVNNTPKPATLSLTKSLGSARIAASDQFAVAIRTGGVGGAPVASGTTTGSGNTVTGGTGTTGVFAATFGTAYTLTEDMAPGSASALSAYSSTLSCVDANGFQTGLPSGVPYNPTTGFTITPVAGAALACTITNGRAASIVLSKALGSPRLDATDQFVVQIISGGITGPVVNSTAASTTTGTGAVVTSGTGTTGTFTATPGQPYTLTERMGSGSVSTINQYAASITCTDSAGLQTGLPSGAPLDPLSGLIITPVAGAAISCTITNTPSGPSLTLFKELGDDRISDTDQFTVAIRTGGVNGTVVNSTADSTTTGTGAFIPNGRATTGAFSATAGTTYTLTETITSGSASALAQYEARISCIDTAAVQPGLPNDALFNPATGFDITPLASTAIECTITNTPRTGLFGLVFLDTGVGGGIANDGIRNGSEPGQAGVTVQMTDCAGTVQRSTFTNSAGEWQFPFNFNGVPVCVQQVNPGSHISTGVSVGGTAVPSGVPISIGGVAYTYQRTPSPDQITFVMAYAASSNSIDFGDVPASLFGAGGAKNGVAGSAVTYAHSFTAGTAGNVVFSIPGATATPANAAWAQTIFADPTCSGSLQPGAVQLFPPVGAGQAVSAGDTLCIVVRQFVPADAVNGAKNDVAVQADLAFSAATPALSATYSLNDITTVGASALDLRKEVRNVTSGGTFGTNNAAKPGDVLEYRITFTNNAASAVSNLVINDTTPAYSVFVSAGSDPLPDALTSCVKTTPANPLPAAPVACAAAQAAGGSGSINWTFTGALAPGASGNVMFQVTVQ